MTFLLWRSIELRDRLIVPHNVFIRLLMSLIYVANILFDFPRIFI